MINVLLRNVKMAKSRQVDITIHEDGKVDFDQIGYSGKACSTDIDDLVKALGTQTSATKKKEYYDKEQVRVNNNR